MGTVIKMYAAGSGGSQDAVAQVDVPMPGHIVGVDWAVRIAPSGADFLAEMQLSFRSSSSFTTNDDRGIISEVKFAGDLTTSGAANTAANKYVLLPDVPVMGGERIYLHLSVTASVVTANVVLVHFDFDLDKISMRRR